MARQWQPGDLLTPADRELLAVLVARATELGYTPTRSEVACGAALRRRFRTWGNVVKAAGLPWINYPEQQRLRARARVTCPSGSDASSSTTFEEKR